ncbi:hypothetical protein VitviT2T_023059 [Vitis vinifera]|uniref:Reverse transcriptase domain-containing protein n=1 Tax=Vitis vinifera TaxID=29760 RepID=A0ABY9DBN5_VITVI|nr:hypothetical protein VitviT2T_023059 [Vitis vinifera]
MVVRAFRSLLSNPGHWRSSLSRLQFEILETLDALALEVSFMEEKVFGALLGCNGDKAPGPKSFSMTFWQFSWDFVKDDVMSFFREFCEHGFFQSSRGLRQGDPFSPYLFVIAMEVFSCFIKRAVDGGFLSGWTVKGRSEEGVQISYLLFVDDTLVFCQASQDQLTYLSWFLMWFEAVLWLRINLEKSELIPIGRVENIDDLTMDFGYRVGSLPSTYLGLSLGAPFKLVTIWDGVEERFRRLRSLQLELKSRIEEFEKLDKFHME